MILSFAALPFPGGLNNKDRTRFVSGHAPHTCILPYVKDDSRIVRELLCIKKMCAPYTQCGPYIQCARPPLAREYTQGRTSCMRPRTNLGSRESIKLAYMHGIQFSRHIQKFVRNMGDFVLCLFVRPHWRLSARTQQKYTGAIESMVACVHIIKTESPIRCVFSTSNFCMKYSRTEYGRG